MQKEPTQLLSDLISDLDWGDLDIKCGKKLQDLVALCEKTQKQGSFTLQLKIKPDAAGKIFITPDFKVSEPKLPMGASIMFVSPSGRITRNDPRQMEIEGLSREPAVKVRDEQVKDGPVVVVSGAPSKPVEIVKKPKVAGQK